MKAHKKNCFFVATLIAALVLPTETLTAQTFTNLHSFSLRVGPSFFNTDGASPNGSLVLAGTTLYGTAFEGGADNMGTVFKINTDGTAFSALYSFQGASDAFGPTAGLVLSGSTLFGTSVQGGQNFAGSVFSGNASGSGYTAIHSFNGGDGSEPLGQMVLANGVLYGTTYTNGTTSSGTLYKVGSGGGNFATLHNFSATTNYINNDGANPYAGLIISGSVLYGVATAGGASGYGTIFKINTDGSSFAVLHQFGGTADGAYPYGGLLLTNGVLYGTAEVGGSGGDGTVYKMNVNGTGYTVLHNFSGSDGAYPQSGLVLVSNMVYGVTYEGGSPNHGVLFGVNTNGTGYTYLHSFSPFTSGTTNNNDGAYPFGSLVYSANALFGGATSGGVSGQGTLFKYTFPASTNSNTNTHPAFFAGEVSLNGGAYYYLTFPNSNIFGFYNYTYFPYLYHYNMGFEYFIDANDGAGGAYLYDFTSGHFWYTSPSYGFPYIYDFSLNAALYYYPDPNNPGQYSSNPRSFYNFATGHVIYQ